MKIIFTEFAAKELLQAKSFYEVEQDFILILAVAHHHRKPFYWLDESK